MQTRIVKIIKEEDLKAYRVPMIVIYEHPEDYPNKYVARIFDIDRPQNLIMLKDTLAEMQQEIQTNTNKMFIGRRADDDPCIVGVWM